MTDVIEDGAARPLYMEDVAVGDEFRSGEYLVSAEEIIGFARQFDPQPFHTDEAAARASFFQGLAASGWHTMAITMRLLVQTLGLVGSSRGEMAQCHPSRRCFACCYQDRRHPGFQGQAGPRHRLKSAYLGATSERLRKIRPPTATAAKTSAAVLFCVKSGVIYLGRLC